MQDQEPFTPTPKMYRCHSIHGAFYVEAESETDARAKYHERAKAFGLSLAPVFRTELAH